MKKLFLTLLVVIPILAWTGPIYILPDSVQIYEIPKDYNDVQTDLYALARISGHSALIKFNDPLLTGYSIIATADSMWWLSIITSSWDFDYDVMTWRERLSNKLTVIKNTTPIAVATYSIPDSFLVICPNPYAYEPQNRFIGITSGGNLNYCVLDTITGDIAGHVSLIGLPTPQGVLTLTSGLWAYMTSIIPPRFVLITGTTITIVDGNEPIFLFGMLIYIINDSSNDVFCQPIGYPDWLPGRITSDTITEKFLSKIEPIFYCRSITSPMIVYNSGRNIMTYYYDSYVGHVFDTVFSESNIRYLGTANILSSIGHDPYNFSWILWENRDGFFLGMFEMTYAGGAISEAPKTPDNIQISAYPNPFNSSVRISFDCHSRANGNPAGRVQVEIFDIEGKRVFTPSSLRATPPGRGRESNLSPFQGDETEGRRGFVWTPSPELPSGIYLVRARFDGLTDHCGTTKRVVYLK